MYIIVEKGGLELFCVTADGKRPIRRIQKPDKSSPNTFSSNGLWFEYTDTPEHLEQRDRTFTKLVDSCLDHGDFL